MAPNRKLARKRAARAERRRARAPGHVARRARLECAGCGADCAHDAVPHESDCGHETILCPVCAVQTCDGCAEDPRVIAAARLRVPGLPACVDPKAIERLNERVSGVSLQEVAGPMRMFMRTSVSCVAACSGRMSFIEGSERWPTEKESEAVPGAVIAFDRRCNTCGETAPAVLGAPMFEPGFVDGPDDDPGLSHR